jgi:hypothetical protein
MNIPRRTALMVVGWSAAGVLAVATVTGVGIAFAGGAQVNGAVGAAPQAAAASPSPSTSATPGRDRPGRRGPGLFPGFPRGRMGGLGGALGTGPLGGELHGEFVVKDQNGKFVTRDVQSGSVTAVSSTSISLKSEDGFTATYVVNGDTKVMVGGSSAAITGVKTGNTAWVVATKSGSTLTATILIDRA